MLINFENNKSSGNKKLTKEFYRTVGMSLKTRIMKEWKQLKNPCFSQQQAIRILEKS